MSAKTVHLIDQAHNVVASAHVTDQGTHFRGIIDLRRMPQALRRHFHELEEIVNGQMLSFLDKSRTRSPLLA
jgi:hypothetical protein